MFGLNLPDTLPSGKSWTEELPQGAVEMSTGSFGGDYGQKVLNIKIAGTIKNLKVAIPYIVGYSEVSPVFNENIHAVQGPYRLKRHLPAMHPYFSGMRATKILSCTGKGTDKRSGPVRGPSGTAGVYEYTYLSIQFEIPKYKMLTDAELEGRPEYLRYTLWDYENNYENIARKDTPWTAPAAPAMAVNARFSGDRYVRQPKGLVKITTYDVHEDYIKLGGIMPVNQNKRASTLNARPFPAFARLDQNYNPLDNKYAQFIPGTLLMLPVKLPPHAQNHPAFLNGQISEDFFPRTVDMEVSAVHFDPPTDDTTTIDLSDAAVFGPQAPETDSRFVLVRGHNLAPLTSPSGTGYIWYTWVNDALPYSPTVNYVRRGNAAIAPVRGDQYACVAGGMIAGVPSTPGATGYWSFIGNGRIHGTPPPNAMWFQGIKGNNSLLYPYSDFEKVWAPVESYS